LCAKCGTFFYVHDHHIVLKSFFGIEETEKLCPNCHTHFHEYLNRQNPDKNDLTANLHVWYKWKYTVKIAITALIILLLAGVQIYLYAN